MSEPAPIRTFSEFWPFYVRAHSKRGTRLCHFVGSTLALVMLAAAATVSPWYLLAAIGLGYGFAWFGHFVIEGNRPATFGHPIFSLAADYRMVFLMMAGRMQAEIDRYVNTPATD